MTLKELHMNTIELHTYAILLTAIETADVTDRPRLLHQLKTFVEIINLRLSQEITDESEW